MLNIRNNARDIAVGKPPCNGCTAETGRSITCHFDGTCQAYIDWERANKEELEKELESKKKHYVYIESKRDIGLKMSRKRKRERR